jgi:hypothetical protein
MCLSFAPILLALKMCPTVLAGFPTLTGAPGSRRFFGANLGHSFRVDYLLRAVSWFATISWFSTANEPLTSRARIPAMVLSASLFTTP